MSNPFARMNGLRRLTEAALLATSQRFEQGDAEGFMRSAAGLLDGLAGSNSTKADFYAVSDLALRLRSSPAFANAAPVVALLIEDMLLLHDVHTAPQITAMFGVSVEALQQRVASWLLEHTHPE